jgi:hypothetical protein
MVLKLPPNLVRRHFSKLAEGPSLEAFINGTVGERLPGEGRLPPWLKTPIAIGKHFTDLKESLAGLSLHTVFILNYVCIHLFSS